IDRPGVPERLHHVLAIASGSRDGGLPADGYASGRSGHPALYRRYHRYAQGRAARAPGTHRGIARLRCRAELVPPSRRSLLEPRGLELGTGPAARPAGRDVLRPLTRNIGKDRKSTRLNSSHVKISYAVFCLKSYGHHRDLHSFPTRRSSDLGRAARAPGTHRGIARLRCRAELVPPSRRSLLEPRGLELGTGPAARPAGRDVLRPLTRNIG